MARHAIYVAALVGLAFFAIPSGATHAINFSRYRNLFLTVQIPSDWTRIGDGHFSIIRNGSRSDLVVEASAPHVNERKVECGASSPSFRVSNAHVFAYSCRIGDRIVYHLEKFGRTYRMGASDSTETIEITANYPFAQRSFWKGVIEQVSASLQFTKTVDDR